MTDSTPRHRLLEVIGLFLKLGTISFGGPAAHIALMEQEAVRKRNWLCREHFLDLLAATSLMPGPNATEMAIHIGYIHAGWLGLIAGGVAFIVPAFLISLALAVVYVRLGMLPQGAALFYGINPAVMAIILVATYRLSIAAGRIVYDTREAIAELFNAPDPLRVIFTLNATHAINIALNGLLRPGDQVVTTGIEHNAVMRPLRAFEKAGVQLPIILCARDGTLDLANAERAITPRTRLVVINHASNVVGTILPVVEIASIAHHAGALLLVDAAQTAGVLPIDVQAMGMDLLAFTGHKGLYGPPGTGGLVIGVRVNVDEIEP